DSRSHTPGRERLRGLDRWSSAIVDSFTARLYGQRRAQHKTERIAAEVHGRRGRGGGARCNSVSGIAFATPTRVVRPMAAPPLPPRTTTTRLTVSWCSTVPTRRRVGGVLMPTGLAPPPSCAPYSPTPLATWARGEARGAAVHPHGFPYVRSAWRRRPRSSLMCDAVVTVATARPPRSAVPSYLVPYLVRLPLEALWIASPFFAPPRSSSCGWCVSCTATMGA